MDSLWDDSIPMWISQPRSPFTTRIEQQALKAWLELMPAVGRSDAGLRFWTVSIPMLAWSYPPVRHALTAVSLTSCSLVRKDPASDFAIWQSRACAHAEKAITGLLTGEHPPEVAIVISALFWVLALNTGNWSNAMNHLAASARLAEQTKLSQMSEPLVAQYVRAFVSEFPPSMHPTVFSRMSAGAQRKQYEIWQRYATPIMEDTLWRLKVIQQAAKNGNSLHKPRVLELLAPFINQLQHIISSWLLGPAVRKRKQSSVGIDEVS